MTITTDPPDVAADRYTHTADSDAALIAAVEAGVVSLDRYAQKIAAETGDNEVICDLLMRAQTLTVGDDVLSPLVDGLILVCWPVAAEDVFDIDLYGVDEDVDPLDLDEVAA